LPYQINLEALVYQAGPKQSPGRKHTLVCIYTERGICLLAAAMFYFGWNKAENWSSGYFQIFSECYSVFVLFTVKFYAI